MFGTRQVKDITDLQEAYDDTSTGTITTDSTRGALKIKRGSASDSDSVLEIENGAGSDVATIDGNGNIISYTTVATGKTVLAKGISESTTDLGLKLSAHGVLWGIGIQSNVMEYITSTVNGDHEWGHGSSGSLTRVMYLDSGTKTLETTIQYDENKIGLVEEYPGTTLPTNAVWAEGQSLATADYPILFDRYGYTHGGSGANFNVIDKRGKFAVGKAASGTFATLGATGGAETHTHAIDPPATQSNNSGTGTNSNGWFAFTPVAVNHSHSTDITSFTSGSGSSLPPYVVSRYIIWVDKQ